MDMRITAKNKFRTLVILLLILAVTVSAALWSVLRTRDGTREAYADTQAADIAATINGAKPWGDVSSVTVGNGDGDNGVVVTIGESDAVDENGIVLKEIVLKTGAQAVVNETLPSAQNELEGSAEYSLVVFDVPVTVQSEAKLTLNADVVFRAGVKVDGTLEINGMAFNQSAMTVSNTLNKYSEIKSEGVIVNGSLNNDGARGGTITVSDGSALTVKAGGALFLKADNNNALGVEGTINNNGSVIYDSAAAAPSVSGVAAQAAAFISGIGSVANNGTYVFYPEKPDTGEGTALPAGDGTALTLNNGDTRTWNNVTLLSFGRTTLKNSENNVSYTFTNVNLGGITNVNSDGSVSEKFTQGANELIFDGGAAWKQGETSDYQLRFLIGDDASENSVSKYYHNTGKRTSGYPLVTVSGTANHMYDGVKIMRNESYSGESVGGGMKISSDAVVYMYGGEISYNAVTQCLNNSAGGGIYIAERGKIEIDGGKITRNALADYGGEASAQRSADGAGIATNGGKVVMRGGEISFNNGTTGHSAEQGSDGGGIIGRVGATIEMSGGSISNNRTGGFGGAMLLYDGSKLTMTGGSVSGNYAAYGGGVNMTQNSSVDVSGGDFSYNVAYVNKATNRGGYGGAICVGAAGYLTGLTATFSGTASVAYNRAVYGGGLAVYTTKSADSNMLIMKGGTITGNTADNGNGVYIFSTSDGINPSGIEKPMLSVSGTASIDTSNDISFNYDKYASPTQITYNVRVYRDGSEYRNTYNSWVYESTTTPVWNGSNGTYNIYLLEKHASGTYAEYYDAFKSGNITAELFSNFLSAGVTNWNDVYLDDGGVLSTNSNANSLNNNKYVFSLAPIEVSDELRGSALAALVYLGDEDATKGWTNSDVVVFSQSATVNRDKFLLDSDTYTFKAESRALQIAAAEGEDNGVARVLHTDGTKPTYSSLAEAVAKANENDTIQILRSATLSEPIIVDKNVTIVPFVESETAEPETGGVTLSIVYNFNTTTSNDPALFYVMNGATLTLGGGGSDVQKGELYVTGNTNVGNISLVTVANGGSFVQNDGITLKGNSTSANAGAVMLLGSGAKATMNGGSIESTQGAWGAVYVGNGAEMIVSGGTISGNTAANAVNLDGKSYNAYGIYAEAGGAVTLNGAVKISDAIRLATLGAVINVDANFATSSPIGITYNTVLNAGDLIVNIKNGYTDTPENAEQAFKLYAMDASSYAFGLRGSSDGDSKNALVVQKAVKYIFDFRYSNGYGDGTSNDMLENGMIYSDDTTDGTTELSQEVIDKLVDETAERGGFGAERYAVRDGALVVSVFSGSSEAFQLSWLNGVAQKTGWTLSTWHQTSKNNVLSAIGDSASLAYTNSSAPIELRSVWTPNQFNITFDSNYTGLGSGAQPSLIEGTMESQIVDYSDLETSNQEAVLTVNNYTAVGFLFAGWSLTRGTDASTQFTDKQKLSADDWDTMIDGVIGVEHEATETEAGYVEYSITLYAVWKNLFSGGVGTSANPFQIGKIEDLYILEATTMGERGSSDSNVSVSEEYYNTHTDGGAKVDYAAENYEGYFFLLTADLTGFKGVIGRTSSKNAQAKDQDEEITASLPNDVQNSENKNGITDNGTPFAGTFNGDGKLIGLAINKQQLTEKQYADALAAADNKLPWKNGDETLLGAGLFGYTVGATISNLTLTGSVHGYSHVGGLVGYAVNTAISSIYNEAAVSSGGHDVGGIVGTYFVTDESGTQYVITNVVNEGAISYAPRLDDKTTALSTQPYWSETKKLSDVQGIRFGGIVGYGITLRLTGGYNTGDVTGRYAVGGVVGILHSLNNNTTSDTTLTNSFNTGAVTATAGLYATVNSADGGVNAEAVNAYVGGLVGRAVGASAIDTAFNSGRVTASWTGVKNTSGEYAGEYVYADLSSPSPSAGSEYIGARGAGGIVGFTSYNKSANEGDLKSIANVYNTGTISAWASVGGIAGYFAYSTVSRAYNGGSVLANGFHFEGGEQVGGGMLMSDGSYRAFLGSLVGTSIGSSLSDVYYNTDKRYEHFTDETLRQIGDYEYTAETLGFAESTFSSDRGRTASQMSVIAANNRPSGFGTDFSGTYWSFLYYADQTTDEAGQAEEGQAGQTYHYPQLNAFAGDGNTVTFGVRSFELGEHSKNSTLVTVPANAGENDKPITDTDTVTISYSLGDGAFTFAGTDEKGSYFAEDGYRYNYKTEDELWQTEVEYKIGGGEAHEELAQLEQPDDPARVGYTFKGWYSDALCREPFSFGSIPASDKTVYAGWEAVTYTFVYEEFSSRGASFVGEHDATFSILNAGAKAQLPIAENVTRRGYTLSGWLYNNKAVDSYRIIAPSGGTPEIEFYSGENAVETVPFNTIVNQQLYLTAVWEAQPYTITYGGLTVEEFDFVDGENATLNGAKENYTITDSFTFAIPQKKGYTFDGWKLVSLDGKTATEDLDSINKEHYAIGDILTGIVSGTVGDIVLEAQWTRNYVTLYLDARGGTIEKYSNYGLDLDISGRYYISVPYYSNGNGDGALAFLFGEDGTFNVKATPPANSGRDFNGWYTVVNPSEDDAAITKNFTVTGDAAGTGSQTIYAGYRTSTHVITISLGDHAQSVDSNMETELREAGFDCEGDFATAKEFTLTGVLHGSSASEALELLVSAIKVTSGWNFLGWVMEDDKEDDKSVPAPIYNVTSDLKITAQYEQNKVAVNFVGLNGELLGSVTIGQGSSIGEDNTDYNAVLNNLRGENGDKIFGYDFKGWYYTDASGVRQDFEITDPVSASMVVYANLQAKTITPQFRLVIDGVGESETISFGKTYSFGAAFGQFPTLSDLLDQLSDEVAKKYLGYQISGWSVGGSAVNVNTVITQEMVNSGTWTIELHAELTKATYSISFNANGGSFQGVTPVGEYRYGEADSVQYHAGSGKWKDGLPVPQRAGHDPAWNVYDANGSRLGDTSITDAAGLIALLDAEGYAGDLSLIAAWTAEVYTVWFYADGGTFTVPKDAIKGITFYAADKTTEVTATGASAAYFTMEVQYGTVPNPPVALDAPQQNGFIFLGWRDSNNAILTVVTSAGQYSQKSPIVAYWTEGKYSITFVTNGGTAISDITEISYGADLSAQLEGKTTERDGYTFAGWYYDSDFNDENKVQVGDTMPSKDLVLYAKWKVNSYKLTLNIAINGGTVEESVVEGAFKELGFTASVAPATNGYTVKITVPYETNLSALNTIAFGDYRLNGTWDGDVLLTFMPASDYEVSGTFKSATGVTVTFYLIDGTEYYKTTVSSEDNTVSEPPAPTRTGYTFGGWFTAEGKAFNFDTPITEDTKFLYAHWNAVEYEVTLRGEGVNLDRIEVAFGTELTWGTESAPLPVPARGGYTFEGWYLDADFSTTAKGTFMPAYDITLYAKWKATEYSIVFEWGLESEKTTVTIDGAYNSALDLSSVGGEVPHYTFIWQVVKGENKLPVTLDDFRTMPNLMAKYADYTSVVGGRVTITVQATYTAIEYAITLEGADPVTVTVKTGGRNSFTKLDDEKTGYTFAGWKLSSSDTAYNYYMVGKNRDEWGVWLYSDEVSEDGNFVPFNEGFSLILTAAYTPKEYTVNFNANGGSVTTSDKKVTYDSVYGILPVPTRNGYTFDGWFTEQEDGTQITANSTVEITGNQTLFAHWTAIEYKIIYNPGTGTNNPENPSVYTYESAFEFKDPTAPTGYRFLYWMNAATGDPVYEITARSMGDITLIAQYKPFTYIVTFKVNGNGATVDPLKKEVTFGSVYGELPVPTRNGYTFVGWYLNDELVNADIQVTTADNHTLTAHWKVIEYTIVYNGLRGTEHSNLTSYTIVDGEIKLNDPTSEPTGYTFDGWYNGEEKVTAIPAGSYGNLTLTARWTANSYTVYFNANGGEGTMDGMTFTYGTAQNLSENDFERAGYTFAGWARDKGATEIEFADRASVINLTAENGGEVTLYAVWRANTYTVTFDPNYEGGTGSMSDMTFTYGTAQNLSANAFARTGYTFAGWATEEGATEDKYANGASVSNLTEVNGGTVTLYAVWTANSYTVHFDANGGEGEMLAQDDFTYDTAKNLTKNAFTRTGYTFKGWARNAGATQAEFADGASVSNLTSRNGATVTLYAVWEANSVSVTFELGDGLEKADGDAAATFGQSYRFTLKAKDGYSLPATVTVTVGAQTYRVAVGTGGTVVIPPVYMTGDIKVTAVGVANAYTVVFVGGTSATGAMNNQTVLYNRETTLTKNGFVRLGYEFLGWAYSDGAKVAIADGGLITINESFAGDIQDKTITLHAVWSPIEYTLKLEANGGSFVGGDSSSVSGTYGGNFVLPEKLERAGYTFLGWSTSASGESVLYTGGASVPVKLFTDGLKAAEEPVGTLYAVWTENVYEVTFDGEHVRSNGAASAVDGNTYSASLTVDTGYTLTKEGISVEMNGTESVQFTYADGVLTISSPVTGYIVITAKAAANTYTIAYEGNGVNIASESGTFGSAITLKDPTRPGFIFLGWYIGDDEGTRYRGSVSVGMLASAAGVANGETITLHAKWQAAEGALTVTIVHADESQQTIGVTSGKHLSKAEINVPKGYDYTYATYHTDSADGAEFVFNNPITEDTIIYVAGGKLITYTITLDYEDGETTDTLIKVEHGQPLDSADGWEETPARVGYTFGGWYNGDVRMTGGSVITIETTETTREFTFTARWNAIDYTVTFNPNHESGTSTTVKYQFGNTVKLIDNPVRNGYTFAGWYHNGKLWESGTTMPAENITLVAMWARKTFTVSFSVGDGATGVADQKIYFEFTATKPTDPVRSGYSFGGWMLDESEYDFGTPVRDNITLTAEWLPRTYSIDYVLGGGVNASSNPASYNIESGTIVLANPTREGFIFLGWYDAEQNGNRVTEIKAGSTGRITLYARWQANTYIVDFVLNGGTMKNTEQIVVAGGTVAFEEPTRENYLFMGWFTDAACTQRYDFSTPVTGDLTLYAKWRLSVISGTASDGTIVTITSDDGFDDGTTIRFAEVTDEATLSEAAGSLAENMTLARLFDIELVAADGTPVSIDKPLSVGISVQGLADAVGRYTVVYVPDGGGTIEEIATHIGEDGRMYFFVEHFSFYAVVDVLDIAPTGGFAWWWILVAVAGCAALAGIIVLLARSMRRYELNYVNGGVPSQKLKESALVDLPLPEREEEVFDGWYYDEMFRDRATLTSMPKQNLILFAKWRKMTEEERAARDRARAEAAAAAAEGFHEAKPKKEKKHKENPLNEIKEDE